MNRSERWLVHFTLLLTEISWPRKHLLCDVTQTGRPKFVCENFYLAPIHLDMLLLLLLSVCDSDFAR